MSRKISIALVITVLATLLVVGVASAAGPGPNGGPSRGPGSQVGQVVAVGAGSLTIEQLDGTEVVVLVDENTRFFDKDNDAEITLADIEVGMWVGGRAAQNDAGETVAFSIVILPEDFDPAAVGTGEHRLDGFDKGNGRPGRGGPNGQQPGNRSFGTLISVDGDTVVVETEDGTSLTLTVTEDTRFMSRDDSLTSIDGLVVGEIVGFGYTEAEDGSLELHGIGTHDGDCPRDGSGRPDGEESNNSNQGFGRGNGTSGSFPRRNVNG